MSKSEETNLYPKIAFFQYPFHNLFLLKEKINQVFRFVLVILDFPLIILHDQFIYKCFIH